LRAKRGTFELTRWNGLGTLPSYIVYVWFTGGRPTIGVVVVGAMLTILAAAELLAGSRVRPGDDRDLLTWSRRTRLIFALSTACWGASMRYVAVPEETVRQSGVLLPLVMIMIASAVYGMYERLVCLLLMVPLGVVTVAGFFIRHDPDAMTLTVAAAVLVGVSLSLNSGLVRHTRRSISIDLERERLMALLSEEHADLDLRVRRDVLTNAPNRLAFTELVSSAITRREPIALLLIDLDGFKRVNDTHGHGAGDDVLVESVERFGGVVGDRLRVFRLGGDEFAVVLSDMSTASSVAEKLVLSMRAPFIVEGAPCAVGASIGIATTDGTLDIDRLLGQADRAMYASKSGGRDRATMFAEDLPGYPLTRAELESALDRNEFVPYYQPIFSSETGVLVAFEALARWRRADGSICSPDEFIPAIESLGLHHQLGGRMFLASLRDRQRLFDEGLIDEAVRVHVNLSPVQLDDLDHVEAIASIARTRGYAVDRLTVELTETSLLVDGALARQILELAQTYGVQVALDDFGTSYSSLSLLRETPFDELKIDREFVLGAVDDPTCRAVIAAVVQIGEQLGVTVTAEGVETTEQAEALKSLNVHRMQGYLYGRPVPLTQLRALLASKGVGPDADGPVGSMRCRVTSP
jgi:diguanylate cyclase (GGDEF)-like protein